MKTTSSKFWHAILRMPLSLVFESLDGTSHIVLVCKRDGGVAYQTKDGEPHLIDGVMLKFYKDGRNRVIDVHKGDRVILDLIVVTGDYDRQYVWVVEGNDVRMRLLRPSTYGLKIDDRIAVVTKK